MPPPAAEDNFYYGACHGEPALLDALRRKREAEDGVEMGAREMMVTNGANQAYAACLLAMCDPGDEVVLFQPYYFSHLVAAQLLGLTALLLPCGKGGQPDVEALRAALRRPGSRVRAVTVVSPSNPSGAVCGRRTGSALLEACAEAGAWLIADEAYEHFVHEGPPHTSLASLPGGAARVVSLHTMSKSYGLAGWRVGSLCYPCHLHGALLKVQDTLPTHATLYSQRLALQVLSQLGTPWVEAHVRSLRPAREQLWAALRPLLPAAAPTPAAVAPTPAAVAQTPAAVARHPPSPTATPAVAAPQPPRGAFYYLLPLPAGVSEDEAVRLLAAEHRLLLLPGSAFGAPGTLRLSYGRLVDAQEIEEVATRLADGVRRLLAL